MTSGKEIKLVWNAEIIKDFFNPDCFVDPFVTLPDIQVNPRKRFRGDLSQPVFDFWRPIGYEKRSAVPANYPKYRPMR